MLEINRNAQCCYFGQEREAPWNATESMCEFTEECQVQSGVSGHLQGRILSFVEIWSYKNELLASKSGLMIHMTALP